MRILHPDDEAGWLGVLERCRPHDFYALPQYHALAEANGEGRAHLFVHEEGDHTIALPLLLRPLATVAACGKAGGDWHDATSVYGYAGPLGSGPAPPADVVQRFQQELIAQLRTLRVVSVFSRLHPLLPREAAVAGLGECRLLQETVSIDLTLAPKFQRAGYRQNHLDGIRKLGKLGVTCVPDEGLRYLDDFIDLYYETMRRAGARDYYFFPRAYFADFLERLRPHAHLFMCHQGDRRICGALVVACGDIAQYHLGGTRDAAVKLAPMKLLVDTVRAWGCERGLHVLHLGGGTTPQPDDSLLHFKKGFSDRRHRFSVWRWVVWPEVYERLCREAAAWHERQGLAALPGDYFPEYRRPTVASGEAATALGGRGC
jgi:hypothetical protein